MNAAINVMQVFRRSLLNHIPYLKRRLKADDVYAEPVVNDTFELVVVRGATTTRVSFDKRKIMGDNARHHLREPRLIQPVCRFVDDIVAEVERPGR
jgi:hypothetical protein